MRREWDAVTYDTLSLPHQHWGEALLSRLNLVGNEVVLDAGAGTGRDTAKLLDLVPRGRVVAIDQSRAMLDRLRDRLPNDERLEVRLRDLMTPLPANSFDVIFSVATFHWILDHERFFRNLAQGLHPDGVLVAECGGEGNIASIAEAVNEVMGESGEPWNFAGAESTRDALVAAGFESAEVRLRPSPFTLNDPRHFRTYLSTVVLGSHLKQMTRSEADQFVSAVTDRIAHPTVDYVRLEITASKSSDRVWD